MPFPPTFTNVWDITFPPDTQLANLLGQDLRNFRQDVMQRMSLLSGTLANRPTPEVVNATWGGVGFGLLYFSTDTGQIFQWNGAAWVDTTASFFSGYKLLLVDNAIHAHTGTTTEDTIYTTVINGNTLGVNGILRGTIKFLVSAQGAPSTTIAVRFGAGQILTSVFPTTNANVLFAFTIGNRAATNSQIETLEHITSLQQPKVGENTSAVDTT